MTFVESSSRSGLLVEHDLFRNPVSTFRDHALRRAVCGHLRVVRRAAWFAFAGMTAQRLWPRHQNLMEVRPATMKASGMACAALSGLGTLPPGWTICCRSAWMVHQGASCRL